MMDEDYYPTPELLEKIKDWEPADFEGMINLLRDVWKYPEYIWRDGEGDWHVSTGGWSGHEEIISAMMQNNVFWLLHWYSSRRGGHYVFRQLDHKIEV